MTCPSPQYESYGFPYIHLLNVLYSFDDCQGLTCHDISVSWWKLYHTIGWAEDTMSSNSQTQLINTLRILKTKETNDIYFLQHVIQNMNLYFGPHEETLYQSSSVPSCWNYSRF